jgi:hypothetical protein
METLQVDAERVAMFWEESEEKPSEPNETPHITGYYVRAQFNGKWGSHDIAVLTRASLFAWLRSRGGANQWAEAVVFGLLRYPPEIEQGETL